MNNQIKNTLIQIIVGSAVVVVGLIALNKFVPTFTLFPKTTPVETDDREIEEILKMDEATPADMPKDENSPIFNEEEATASTNIVPENVTPNIQYSLDKRLKAGNMSFASPSELQQSLKMTFTKYLHSEYCPKSIERYEKNIKINFTLSRDDLVNLIHFVAVQSGRNYYAFKPQKGNNLLMIPNKFSPGTHEITYGFVFKSDIFKSEVNKREVPFYARKCEISIKK
jgi:hypothetical protein